MPISFNIRECLRKKNFLLQDHLILLRLNQEISRSTRFPLFPSLSICLFDGEQAEMCDLDQHDSHYESEIEIDRIEREMIDSMTILAF